MHPTQHFQKLQKVRNLPCNEDEGSTFTSKEQKMIRCSALSLEQIFACFCGGSLDFWIRFLLYMQEKKVFFAAFVKVVSVDSGQTSLLRVIKVLRNF